MAKLILIDLSAIYWAAWHASADEELSTAYARTIEKVHSLKGNGDLCAVCCDAPPYFRKEILPTYKAQRDAPPEQAIEQLRRVKARLEADGVLLWSAQGFEADDVIATAVSYADCYDVEIASSDKDLMQLVFDGEYSVWMRSLRDGAKLGSAEVEAKFGVPPRLMLDLLSLVGDASDNVPGVPGVGPKTAAKLLGEYGSLDGVFANVDKTKRPKLQEALFANADAARLARKLITLRTDAPIDFADLFKPREVKPLHPQEEPEDMDTPDDMAEDGEIISEPRAAQPPSPEPQPQQSAAITTADPVPQPVALARSGDWNLSLEPATIGAAYKLAKGLAESRLYTRFPNAEAIWAIIIRGREMGLGALTALDLFHLVEGKPTPHAHLLIARCKAHPDCEYFQFLGGDATYAEYETKNRDNPKPTRLKFTIEQAKRAGLVKPGSNWDKRPDEMLRKTCAVQLGRIEYPEATGGLYAMEEIGDAA